MKRKRILSFFMAIVICLGMLSGTSVLAAPEPQQEAWDLLNHEMAPAWEEDGWSRVTKKGSIEQKEDSLNIYKDTTGTRDNYNWIVAKPVLPEDSFTLQVRARVNGPTDIEGNEISVRVGQQLAAMFLTYGTEGQVSPTFAGDAVQYILDTTVWHDYTMVVKRTAGGCTTTLYVDEELAWFEQPTSGYAGADLVRFGADNGGMCDLDVASVRLGSGQLPPVQMEEITGVTLSSYEKMESETADIEVYMETQGIADGSQLALALVNARGQKIDGITAAAEVQQDSAVTELQLPDSLSTGIYYVQVSCGAMAANSDGFEVLLERERPELPQFYAQGYTIEMEDYKYNRTEEFNFPSIIDTQEYPLPDGGTPLGRYYLFYAPHDAPAGLCLMTADSLDGPWTEYDDNPFIAKTWPKEDGSGNYYNVSHVSSPHIIWNSTYNEYFMYFHGENNVSRYATSTDMINWTYGGEVVRANDFSPTGSGHTEASYARVFEYSVPGLGNKYIMTLMINNAANMRKIFWAHSVDGKEWTAVKTPLLSPDSIPELDYKGNLSGAYFFELDGRCYIIAHASTGNMYLFEVGQKFDEEIHWGLFYDSVDDFPDYTRAGAPCFMQGDDGTWHMFYEGGRRLHANIVHARTLTEAEKGQIRNIEVTFPETRISAGQTLIPEIGTFLKDNSELAPGSEGLTFIYHSDPAEQVQFDENGFTAAVPGDYHVWVEAIYNDLSVLSEKTTLRVIGKAPFPQPETGTAILDNSMMSGNPKDNLELPWVIKAGEKYHLYYNYVDGATAGIALATADSPDGPWTPHNDGAPILTGAGGPAVIYNDETGEYWMYYTLSNNNKSVRRAVSADGINFSAGSEVINSSAFGSATKDNAYQVSVYEHPIAGKDNRYIMLLTGNPGGKKALMLAWSNDGINWENDQTNLLLAETADGGNIASPRLMVYNESCYVTFHNSSGNIGHASVSEDFSQIEHLGTLYDSVSEEPDNGRAADGFFYNQDGVMHMYYTAGSNKGSGAAASRIAHSRILLGDSSILFEDDFENGTKADWAPEGGSWSVVEEDGNHLYQQAAASGGANNFVGDPQWTDYAFEALIRPTSGNAVVTMSGRVQDAGNRYTIGFNRGKLVVAKKVNGSDSTLYSAAYQVETGVDYRMRLEFEGSDIRVYVNDILEASAVDESHRSGKVGIATYNTSALFDDVAVYRLGEAPDAPNVAIKEFGDHQVFQRSLNEDGTPADSLSAEVTVSGTYTGEAVEKIEVRVLAYGGTNEIIGWTGLDHDPGEGTYSGTLNVPQGGWYQLEVRGCGGDDEVIAEKLSSRKWGVGVNILCVGQSNMQGHGKAPYTEADDLVANFRSGSWKHLKDPYDGAGGSMVPSMGNALTAELGIPVGFVPAADSGSGLHQANIGHAAGRYWLNRNTENPASESTIYGKSIARARAAGGVELIVWNQGETDGRLSIPKDVYMADMRTLLDYFRTDLELSKIPMFIAQIGNHAENLGETSTDLAYTEIRTAQRDLDDGENFFLAATEMEFDRVDTAHYNTAALNEIGKRYANAICYYYGLSDYYRGPEIVSAAFADAANDKVVVTLKHRGGSDITPEDEISGFYVYDGAEQVTVETAARADAEHILLTLERPVSGSGEIRYLFGFDPPRSNVVKDNTPLQLPLEATGDAVAITAAPAPDKEALEQLVKLCNGYREADYTAASWSGFEAALNSAREILGDEAADQEIIDAALTRLERAAADLKPKPAEVDPEVQNVINKIKAIGKVGTGSKAAIQAARAAYDKLPQGKKQQVGGYYNTLKMAEVTYAKLVKEQEDQAAAQRVIDRIKAIGRVTADAASKAKIDEARKAYNALSADQKAKVTNYQTLTSAETRYKELDKQAVKQGKIYRIGNYRYKVTSLKKAEVTVTGVKSRKMKTISVKDTVKIKGKKFKITAIGQSAFKNCKKATKATIGKNVRTIGKNAFYKCSKLKRITIKGSKLKKVGRKAFSGIHAKAKIKVPKSRLKKYQKLLGNKGQKRTVKITK